MRPKYLLHTQRNNCIIHFYIRTFNTTYDLFFSHINQSVIFALYYLTAGENQTVHCAFINNMLNSCHYVTDSCSCLLHHTFSLDLWLPQ